MREQAIPLPPGPVPAAAPGGKRILPRIDYAIPPGAPALYPPDSVAWAVFKNPVALFVGGIAAVLLELSEPRVRSGVWEHSIFPTDPLTRLQRTGYVTHVSVYAPANVAARVITGVTRMHERVRGTTPAGEAYHANDPELLNWVQCTVGFGFMEAYSAYCRRLTLAEKDRSYLEAKPSADLFLAHGAPLSVAEQQAQFEAMRPKLEPHAIIGQFLDIMLRTKGMPLPLRPFQGMMVRAAIALLPDWARKTLELDGEKWRLRGWERRTVRMLGALFERLPIPGTPPVEASKRLGLPANYLYRRRKA
ncbi:oxygenase MpaB family protein [Sphingomonas kyeonggiensis]|uniref:oxygenase MpaB family protein n=1 Tax=Sphingomonas kyeonggiensis TaxID=1268553 RepID=UPI0027D840EE|nr:oxygenase MpaB family protein [Sphingomonas kyeonggiensis]